MGIKYLEAQLIPDSPCSAHRISKNGVHYPDRSHHVPGQVHKSTLSRSWCFSLRALLAILKANSKTQTWNVSLLERPVKKWNRKPGHGENWKDSQLLPVPRETPRAWLTVQGQTLPWSVILISLNNKIPGQISKVKAEDQKTEQPQSLLDESSDQMGGFCLYESSDWIGDSVSTSWCWD